MLLATTIPSPNPSPLPRIPKISTYRNLPVARMRSFRAARFSGLRSNTGILNARRKIAHNASHANATATPAITGITKSRMSGFYFPIPVPVWRTISPANMPTNVATAADMPIDGGFLIVKGKKERKRTSTNATTQKIPKAIMTLRFISDTQASVSPGLSFGQRM
jgi:hypothetical protein